MECQEAWQALSEPYLLPCAEDVKLCVLPAHPAQELSLISVYLPTENEDKSRPLLGTKPKTVLRSWSCADNFTVG